MILVFVAPFIAAWRIIAIMSVLLRYFTTIHYYFSLLISFMEQSSTSHAWKGRKEKMEFHDRFSISKAGYDHNFPSDVIYCHEFLGKSGGDSREEVCVCSSCCSSCSHPSSFLCPGVLHNNPICLRHHQSNRTQDSRFRPEASATETPGIRLSHSAPIQSSRQNPFCLGTATGPSSSTVPRSS